MAAPLEEVIAFARSTFVSNGRRLDVAIVFAESMLRELKASVREWESAAGALRRERDALDQCPAVTPPTPGRN